RYRCSIIAPASRTKAPGLLLPGRTAASAPWTVSPTTDPTRRTHAAVRPRHLPDRTLHCLVLSSLEEGEYTVWRSPGIPHGTVTVSGGAVSEYHWR
ncbi:hypothetical protein AB0399_40220, partial [Streptomyces sp. NPDC088194]|uniref:hypothetical protein n=1 Tax=Streptomyces sp. NPDC088194 TaxID=3154931 RepID=UPI00344DE512